MVWTEEDARKEKIREERQRKKDFVETATPEMLDDHSRIRKEEKTEQLQDRRSAQQQHQENANTNAYFQNTAPENLSAKGMELASAGISQNKKEKSLNSGESIPKKGSTSVNGVPLTLSPLTSSGANTSKLSISTPTTAPSGKSLSSPAEEEEQQQPKTPRR